MNALDPALKAAIEQAVRDAVGATVPYAHAGTVIGSLVAVIVWTWLWYIPRIEQRAKEATDARLGDKDKMVEFAKQLSPVLERAIEALKGRGNAAA